MRTLKINNSKLVEYLKENGKIAGEINKIVTQWQKTDEHVKKLSMKMERIKEKIRPLVADELKKLTELGEF
jgi:peptidoglycan hydrolase CwlO-like protein